MTGIDFKDLPESLSGIMPMSDLPGMGCPADSSDCASDAITCTSDGCDDCDDVVEEPTSISIVSSSSTTSSITLVCSVHTRWGGTVWVTASAGGRTGQSSTYTMGAGATRNISVTVSGLSSGTGYNVTATLHSTQASNITSDTAYVTTQRPSVTPWSWTSSNGAATSAQTRNAYSILQGNRTADDFSHNVWNDLIDKVVEMRQALGYSWTTDTGRFPSASGCKVSAGEALSALKYNAMRTNVGSIRSTGIPDVSAGDEITGYMIVHVTDVLNDIIADM